MPALGKLLDFGKVMIVTKDRKNPMYRFVASPMSFLENLQQQVTAAKETEQPK